MKTTSVKYILLLILFFACDKEEISVNQSESFLKFFGVGLKDRGVQVLTTEEGYLVMANIENPGRGKDICLFQLDEYGNSTAPMTIIGGDYEDVGNVIKLTNDNRYVIAGYSRVSQFAKTSVFVVLVDLNSIEPQPTFNFGDDQDNAAAADLLVLESGNIIITGYTETSHSAVDKGENMLLLQISNQGDSISWSDWGKPNSNERANAIIPANETEYILVGHSSTESSSKSIYAIRWQGGAIAAEDYEPKVQQGYSAEAIAIVRNNEYYYLACNVSPLGSNSSQVQLIKCNSENWFRNDISQNKSFGAYTFNTVSEMKLIGNSLYISGTSSSAMENRGNMFLLETDLDGTNPIYHYSGDSTTFEGNSFDIAHGSGFILTGAAYIGEQSTIALSKIQ